MTWRPMIFFPSLRSFSKMHEGSTQGLHLHWYFLSQHSLTSSSCMRGTCLVSIANSQPEGQPRHCKSDGQRGAFARKICKLEKYIVTHHALPPSKLHPGYRQPSLLDNATVFQGVQAYLGTVKLAEVSPHSLKSHIEADILPALRRTTTNGSIQTECASGG